jgi:hypothetical protein
MRTFELGEVMAERRVTFEADAGWSRDVWIRLGKPRADPLGKGRSWLCPYQIAGLERDGVNAIFGADAMQALLLAVHTIPAELAALMKNPGGHFIYLGKPEESFLSACRSCIEVLGDDVLPPELSSLERTSRSRGQFFVNVDLDIETELDPEPLIRAFEPHAYSLERPPGRASFELNLPIAPSHPEPLIREFVRLVGLMPPPVRAVWDKASRRVLDIGIQSRRRPFSETHAITASTLAEVARVGAEIAFTVYSFADEDEANVAG